MALREKWGPLRTHCRDPGLVTGKGALERKKGARDE